MRRVHPFLSPSGIGFTLLIFLGLGFSLWKDGGEIFSPGALSAQGQTGMTLGGFGSHADFATACENCHAPLETTQGDLCLHCHTTIFTQIQTRTGTHAGLPGVEQCRDCHPDHLGRDFNPTRAAFNHFDHSLTRFSLGWHQFDYDLMPVDCNSCHNTEDGFEFIPQACELCHAGENPDFMADHILDFGEDCIACHDGTDQMTNFDHTITHFPLDGMHASTSCAGCHTDGQFEGTPSQCISCHIEPAIHAGLFSTECTACHTSDGWSILVGMDGTTFDHFSQSGFSLIRHQTDHTGSLLPCNACHTSDDGFEVGFNLSFCIECHTSDNPVFMAEHQVQFGTECLSCHDGVDRMDDFDHNQSFVLDGAHAEVPCESCHTNKVFNDTPTACSDCHAEPDIHAGYFGLQCENCHTTAAWAPAKMQSHAFPLNHGDQGLVQCEVCHTSRYTEYTCYGCHERQPGEILDEHQEEGITGTRLEDCVACHPDGLKHEDD